MGSELRQQWEDMLTKASQELLKLTIEYHKQATDLEFKLQHETEQINKKSDEKRLPITYYNKLTPLLLNTPNKPSQHSTNQTNASKD